MRPRPRTLAERARALGAIAHHQVDARADYFEQVLRFLIMGNVRRGQLYPLCVGAERVMQAQTIARMARELGSDTVAHGCTAAGNDQVRFEVALRTLAPDLKVLAPVRDQRLQARRRSSTTCSSAACRCRRRARSTRSTAACGASPSAARKPSPPPAAFPRRPGS